MKNYISLLVAIIITMQLQAQSLDLFPYYTVAHNNGTINALFKFDATTNSWAEVGTTGTNNIKAIATDQINNVMYAVNEGTFGKIEVQTGLFTPIGSIGTGNGDVGEITLNNIEGLTYDSANEIIFATHRIESGTVCEPIENSNDLLFQIDVTTGQFIAGAMLDSNDVNDIAFNPYTGELYAIQNQEAVCAVTIINAKDGTVDVVLYDLEKMDAASLSFSPFGELFCTTGSNAENHPANCFKFIDLQNMGTFDLSFPDPTNAHQDFRSMDFFTARNDLALKLELNSDVSEPVGVGETVNFDVTLYNQGDIENIDIVVTNYIPDGLVLSDLNWTAVPGTNSAEFIYAGPLLPEDSATISLSLTVDVDFTGSLISSYAEITNSYNPNITDSFGDLLPLPDFDSQPDAGNNELRNGHPIVDNMVNQRGPSANEDEDDHDVSSITIQNNQTVENLMYETTVEPALCNSLGSAEIQILGNGLAPFTHKWLDASGELYRLEVTDNSVHQVNNLEAGTYYVSITDASDKISSFAITVSTLADEGGNTDCTNCPEHLITPDNLLNGTFKAKNTIEINGFIDGSENTEFLMCE